MKEYWPRTSTQPVDPGKCLAYHFSNDKWDQAAVSKLDKVVKAQTTKAERGAALMIGSGGMPYMLARFNARTFINVDLYDGVLQTTARRVNLLAGNDNWDTYHAVVSQGLPKERSQEALYRVEAGIAKDSGLAADFDDIRARGAESEFHYIQGDIIDVIPHIGTLADSQSIEFTAVNITNAADYIGTSAEAGKAILASALRKIPLAEDAFIIDSSLNSSSNLHPAIYAAQDYLA